MRTVLEINTAEGLVRKQERDLPGALESPVVLADEGQPVCAEPPVGRLARIVPP